MTEQEHRRHNDKPWFRDVRFLLPMILTVLMAGTSGFVGSWVASSNRLAALDQIAVSLQRSVEDLKRQIGSASGAIQALTGALVKVQSDGEHNTRDIAQLRTQVENLTREVNAWSGAIAKIQARQEKAK